MATAAIALVVVGVANNYSSSSSAAELGEVNLLGKSHHHSHSSNKADKEKEVKKVGGGKAKSLFDEQREFLSFFLFIVSEDI